MKIGTVIRLARKKKGLTRVGLARKAEVSASGLWMIEKHQRQPTILILTALAYALDTTPGELLKKVNADGSQKPV